MRPAYALASTAATSVRRIRYARVCYPIIRPIQTRWADNDSYGHINNVVYYSLVDSVVNAWEQQVNNPSNRSAIGLVVDTGCTYFEPTAYPETLEVGLGVAHLGRSSVRYRFGVFRVGSELPAAQGHYVHTYVDATTRRPCAIPADIRAALEAHPFTGEAGGEHKAT